MSYVEHAADALEAADRDDDEARASQAERDVLRLTVSRLMESGLPRGSGDARFIEHMDLRLNVMREAPTRAEVERLKALAWTHRRRMPRHLAPRLPPHDPLVREGKLA